MSCYKMPVAMSSSQADMERYLDEQMKRLRTDYIDIYLLHNLSPAVWEKVRKFDGAGFMDRAAGEGKILHKGFHFITALKLLRRSLIIIPGT